MGSKEINLSARTNRMSMGGGVRKNMIDRSKRSIWYFEL